MRVGGSWFGLCAVGMIACGYPQPPRVYSDAGTDGRVVDARIIDASPDASIDASGPRLMFYGSSLGNDETQRDAYLATRFALSRVGDATPIDAGLLATTDLVLVEYLNNTHTTAEANALATWVSNGGAVLVTSGWAPGNTDLARYNALMATVGLVFKEPKVSGPITTFFTHPISMGTTSLPFVDGYELTLPASGSTEVGRLSSQPVLAAITRGSGRIVACGDDFFNFTSQWSGDVPGFWVKLIDWLAI